LIELSDWFHFSSGVRQGCTVAPSVFLLTADWFRQRTAHQGISGATLGTETFTAVDYADEVALLAEMLEVLILALDVTYWRTKPVPWALKLTDGRPRCSPPLIYLSSSVLVSGNPTAAVKSFFYRGWSCRFKIKMVTLMSACHTICRFWACKML